MIFWGRSRIPFSCTAIIVRIPVPAAKQLVMHLKLKGKFTYAFPKQVVVSSSKRSLLTSHGATRGLLVDCGPVATAFCGYHAMRRRRWIPADSGRPIPPLRHLRHRSGPSRHRPERRAPGLPCHDQTIKSSLTNRYLCMAAGLNAGRQRDLRHPAYRSQFEHVLIRRTP